MVKIRRQMVRYMMAKRIAVIHSCLLSGWRESAVEADEIM